VEADVVIVGSGGAGLTAAITAASAGLEVLVIEKTGYFGGATAISGGGIWIPANSVAAAAGYSDTPEAAKTYISQLVGEIVRTDLLDAFVDNASKVLDFMQANSLASFDLHHNEPDYYQELDGAVMEGRLLSPADYDGRLLGDYLSLLRPPLKEFNAPMGFMVSFDDLPHLMNIGKSFSSTIHVLKLVLRYARDRISYPRGTRLTMGNALVARLLRSALDRGISLWNYTPMTGLIYEQDRVVGVEVQRDGVQQSIRARRGVILASGGFSASLEMRRKFIPYPEQHVSFMPDGNTGDGLSRALELGAQLETGNHADAAYTVMSVLHKPDGSLGKYPHVFLDRPKPGCIAVNAAGKRFGNEATANLVKAMHDSGSVPAHLICDHPFIKKYGLGLVFPGGVGLKKMLKAGYVIQSPTIAGLAQEIGADPQQLEQTVAQVNRYAQTGVDSDFHKGESAADLALGDPEHGPNPCLGKIEQGPFYAVKIFPGDGSTMLGLRVNNSAQVLQEEGDAPIPGLYACGLDMNVLWRGREPSHGSYNALSMTFGHLAAQHIAGKS
jgi:succinate dehydrogenase/fumarate reductase flavoprotein subunit